VIHWIRHNLCFFFTGLLCIVWFLFRTGTKPSRMEYPCQQASLAGAKMHSGESFFGCDDALEAVLFSVLIEMIKPRKIRLLDGNT